MYRHEFELAKRQVARCSLSLLRIVRASFRKRIAFSIPSIELRSTSTQKVQHQPRLFRAQK
ncbi:hypothetical protein ACPOL_6326 [Acidisarcina polymorpha]|uniref:Uncharacterized protein n=1 Tax=Acidisarcina polymorpha TaxID=2211140 RepID=A0A2Z5G9A0_9BACT|nr:hypothetical protein ACPOL_6326 [Acidisarcina polymorpha]